MKICFVTLLMLFLASCPVRQRDREYIFLITDDLIDSLLVHSFIDNLDEVRSIARWIEDPNEIGDMSNYGDEYMYYLLNIFDSRFQTILRVQAYNDAYEEYLICRNNKGDIKLCLNVAFMAVDNNDNSLFSSMHTIIKGDSIVNCIIRRKQDFECPNFNLNCKYDTIVRRMLIRDWLLEYYNYPKKSKMLKYF